MGGGEKERDTGECRQKETKIAMPIPRLGEMWRLAKKSAEEVGAKTRQQKEKLIKNMEQTKKNGHTKS